MSEIAVKLGQYKGIEVTARKAVVTEEEVLSELERARSYAATTRDKVDEPAEMGDQIVIDFVGCFDGEPFPGGTGENYSLVLGSNTFIPGFEDQLVGAKVGEEVNVVVTFPEDYDAKEYAGKEAVFKCTVNGLRCSITPELTDEVVAQISNCKTVDEFKAFVEGEIRTYKEEQLLQEKENEVLGKLVQSSEIDIPEDMIDARREELKQGILAQLQNTGHTIEQFYQFNNVTEEQMNENLRITAIQMLEGQAILGMVAQEEGFAYTEEELAEEVKLMAGTYQMDVEEFKGMIGEGGVSMIGQDILNKRALSFLVESAVEV